MTRTPRKKAAAKKAPAPTKKAVVKKASAPVARRSTAPAIAAHRPTNGRADAKPNGNNGSNGNGNAKLGKGGLEQLVKAHLKANPDTEFTPGAVGRALNRSAGAILNALEKWSELGQPVALDGEEIGTVVQTKDRPKSFALVTKKASKPTRRSRKS